MDHQERGLAKFSRPLAQGVLARPRLFRRLEQGLARPVVWVTGPAGYGKTTLVSSYLEHSQRPHLWYQMDEGDNDWASFIYYLGLAAGNAGFRTSQPLPLLTPEYRPGITVFTRRFFEELYRRLSTPFLLVLDNYQEVPADAPFHDLLVHGLEVLPPGINLMLISRYEPPPGLVRLEAASKVDKIDWHELRLTFEETQHLLAAKGLEKVLPETVENIHGLVKGWAAGLVLFLEKLKREDFVPETLGALPREDIFHYFAREIFLRAAPDMQDFLLRTAFLPRMSASLAELASGQPRAEQILATLYHSHFFTERRLAVEPVYSYHPLFQEFLLLRAGETFSPEELGQLRQQTARLLEQEGQVEEAALLYTQAADLRSLAGLIQREAPRLLAQGRNQTLETWLEPFPEHALEATPVLLYWSGVARLSFNPALARGPLERAFQLTAGCDRELSLLAWSAIVDTYRYEWDDFTPLDHWIGWLEKELDRGLEFPDPDIEARVMTSLSSALQLRQPQHPRILTWTERALALAREHPDINFRIHSFSHIAIFFGWRGKLVTARTLLDEMEKLACRPEASPLMKLTWSWLEAFFDIWIECSYEPAQTKISEALAYARKTGVYLWDHMLLSLRAYCCFAQGDLIASHAALAEFAVLLDGSRRHLYCQYHYLLGWHEYLKGNRDKAQVHASTALEYAEATGNIFPLILCHLEYTWILYEKGAKERARASLVQTQRLCDRTKSSLLHYASRLVEAKILFDEGNEQEGLVVLREAMALGRAQGFFSPPWWCEPPFLAELCLKALQHGIEPAHVREVVGRRQLVPDLTDVTHDEWPWPVKVFTFGRFALFCKEEAVLFSRKVQKKPLEMLKALIAFGGAEVQENQITDILWPDADGDVAHKSFATTLHRLRQLFGVKGAIRLHEGRLSLDRRYCWVDALWFSDRVEACLLALSKTPEQETIHRAEKLLAVYRGPFLEGDLEQGWAEPFRERLQRKCLQLLEYLGEYWEGQDDIRQAIIWYEKGVEIDELAEPLYLRLMLCYLRLGWKAEVVRVYRRCRETLAAVLGIKPSARLRQIYEQLDAAG